MKKAVAVFITLTFCLMGCAGVGTSFFSSVEKEGKILDSVEDVLVVGFISKKRLYEYGDKDRKGQYTEECSYSKPIKVSQNAIDPFLDVLKDHFRRIHRSDQIRPQLVKVYTELDKECHPLMVSRKTSKGSQMQGTFSADTLFKFIKKNSWNKEYFHKFAKNIIDQEKKIGRTYDAYFYVTFEIDQRTLISEVNFIDLIGEKGNRVYSNEIKHVLEAPKLAPESPQARNRILPTQQEVNEWFPKLMTMQVKQLKEDLPKYQSANKAVQGLVETDRKLGL